MEHDTRGRLDSRSSLESVDSAQSGMNSQHSGVSEDERGEMEHDTGGRLGSAQSGKSLFSRLTGKMFNRHGSTKAEHRSRVDTQHSGVSEDERGEMEHDTGGRLGSAQSGKSLFSRLTGKMFNRHGSTKASMDEALEAEHKSEGMLFPTLFGRSEHEAIVGMIQKPNCVEYDDTNDNSNGKFLPLELVNMLASISPHHKMDLVAFCIFFDVNGDGLVAEQEYERAEELFQSLDKDKDGVLTVSEMFPSKSSHLVGTEELALMLSSKVGSFSKRVGMVNRAFAMLPKASTYFSGVVSFIERWKSPSLLGVAPMQSFPVFHDTAGMCVFPHGTANFDHYTSLLLSDVKSFLDGDVWEEVVPQVVSNFVLFFDLNGDQEADFSRSLQERLYHMAEKDSEQLIKHKMVASRLSEFESRDRIFKTQFMHLLGVQHEDEFVTRSQLVVNLGVTSMTAMHLILKVGGQYQCSMRTFIESLDLDGSGDLSEKELFKVFHIVQEEENIVEGEGVDEEEGPARNAEKASIAEDSIADWVLEAKYKVPLKQFVAFFASVETSPSHERPITQSGGDAGLSRDQEDDDDEKSDREQGHMVEGGIGKNESSPSDGEGDLESQTWEAHSSPLFPNHISVKFLSYIVPQIVMLRVEDRGDTISFMDLERECPSEDKPSGGEVMLRPCTLANVLFGSCSDEEKRVSQLLIQMSHELIVHLEDQDFVPSEMHPELPTEYHDKLVNNIAQTKGLKMVTPGYLAFLLDKILKENGDKQVELISGWAYDIVFEKVMNKYEAVTESSFVHSSPFLGEVSVAVSDFGHIKRSDLSTFSVLDLAKGIGQNLNPSELFPKVPPRTRAVIVYCAYKASSLSYWELRNLMFVEAVSGEFLERDYVDELHSSLLLPTRLHEIMVVANPSLGRFAQQVELAAGGIFAKFGIELQTTFQAISSIIEQDVNHLSPHESDEPDMIYTTYQITSVLGLNDFMSKLGYNNEKRNVEKRLARASCPKTNNLLIILDQVIQLSRVKVHLEPNTDPVPLLEVLAELDETQIYELTQHDWSRLAVTRTSYVDKLPTQISVTLLIQTLEEANGLTLSVFRKMVVFVIGNMRRSYGVMTKYKVNSKDLFSQFMQRSHEEPTEEGERSRVALQERVKNKLFANVETLILSIQRLPHTLYRKLLKRFLFVLNQEFHSYLQDNPTIASMIIHPHSSQRSLLFGAQDEVDCPVLTEAGIQTILRSIKEVLDYVFKVGRREGVISLARLYEMFSSREFNDQHRRRIYAWAHKYVDDKKKAEEAKKNGASALSGEDSPQKEGSGDEEPDQHAQPDIHFEQGEAFHDLVQYFQSKNYVTIDSLAQFLFQAFSFVQCKEHVDTILQSDAVNFAFLQDLYDLAVLRDVFVTPKALHRDPTHRYWRLAVNLLLPVTREFAGECPGHGSCPLVSTQEAYSFIFNPSVWMDYLPQHSFQSYEALALYLAKISDDSASISFTDLHQECTTMVSSDHLPDSLVSIITSLYSAFSSSSLVKSLVYSTGGPLQRAIWGGQSAKILSLALHPEMHLHAQTLFTHAKEARPKFLRASVWERDPTILYILTGVMLQAHHTLGECPFSSPIYNILFFMSDVTQDKLEHFHVYQRELYPQGCEVKVEDITPVGGLVREFLANMFPKLGGGIDEYFLIAAVMSTLVLPHHLIHPLSSDTNNFKKEIELGEDAMPKKTESTATIDHSKKEIVRYLSRLIGMLKGLGFPITDTTTTDEDLISMAYVVTMIDAMTYDQFLVNDKLNNIMGQVHDSHRFPQGLNFHKLLPYCRALMPEYNPWVGRVLGLPNHLTNHPAVHFHPIFSFNVALLMESLIKSTTSLTYLQDDLAVNASPIQQAIKGEEREPLELSLDSD